MKYHGSCHCGAVQYDVEIADLNGAMTCDCSRCHRLGWVLKFVPAGDFTLLAGGDNLIEYRFNTKRIAHLFCKTCGIESFARGVGSDGSETAAINLRCLDGVDLDALAITAYKGKDV